MTIPSRITKIEDGAFAGCSSLADVYYGGSESQWRQISIGKDNDELSRANIHYNGGGNSAPSISKDFVVENGVLTKYNGSGGAVTIPSGVTSIGGAAFWNCFELTEVTVPDSVTTIGKRAFLNCSGMTSVIFGDGIKSIGPEAFSGCSGLTNVTIPNIISEQKAGKWRGSNIE